MSSSPVWVQLYYEGKDEPEGHPTKIKPIPEDVDALVKVTKSELSPDIDHAPPSRIFVYPPGTKPPFSQANSIRPGKPLKEVIDELKTTTPPTSDDYPLIVVAQGPPDQLQPATAMAMAKQVQENLKNSVCLFVDEDEKEAFGCGFAVSADTVYTCAHHWQTENKSIGSEMKCYYGKTENKKLYTMKIIKFDDRLDYCVLERKGDAPFPDFLQILDKSEDLPQTAPVFLAAYQIGLNEDVKAFNLELGLGFSPGHIIKKGHRHFLHSCPAFKGDSGGAIVICGGQLVGIHLESVNEFRQTLDMNSLDLKSVADSVEDLIHSHHSGCVALFPSAIKP